MKHIWLLTGLAGCLLFCASGCASGRAGTERESGAAGVGHLCRVLPQLFRRRAVCHTAEGADEQCLRL